LLLPRFWSPYARRVSDEWVFGGVTAGADPLLRHVYGLDAHWGEGTRKPSFQGFYQYDRFRPTFLLTARDTREPVAVTGGSALRTERELQVRATVPVQRRIRVTQAVSLAWRRERETITGAPQADRLDLGGLELAWTLSTARQYPYSISPIDGYRLRVAYLKEDPALGSEVALGKLVADARGYVRVFGESDTLALRLGGGTTFGRPSFRRSFAVGGFPDGALFDVVATNHSVLRGYPQDGGARAAEFSGRRFVHANAEYRFPLGHPEHGWRTLPLFVRHLHAAVFFDAAHAWSGELRLGDVRTGAGAALGTDVFVGHGLPLTFTAGVARGFASGGDTRFYLNTGLAF
jgi:outer membrane protein assembly factor BamA